MELPIRIEKCPIVDAIFEIRFTSNIYSSAVFGLIYNILQENYPEIEKLPILQIPEELREKDPTLKFKPNYKATGDEFTIQIGPEVLAISSRIPYVGWKKFSKEIERILKSIFEQNIIKRVHRLGLRYINYFDVDIFNNLKMKVLINNEVRDLKKTVFRTELITKNFLSTLQIANNATNVIDGKESIGSILDIDIFKEFGDNSFSTEFVNLINEAHHEEKKLFFELFTDEFLNSLNPVYS